MGRMDTSRAHRVATLAAAILVASALGGCSSASPPPAETTAPSGPATSAPVQPNAIPPVALAGLQLGLKKTFSGFDSPVYLTNAGDGSRRLFVVEQGGLVKVIESNRVLAKPYLDLRSKTAAGGERGLLGMAFSPGYRVDGKVYVDYTDMSGNTVIECYTASDPSASAPVWSAPAQLLHIDQPFPNHNGGCLQFGPDGYLYIGMGDGGSAGDPGNRAQNKDVLLGKILRIDVGSAGGGRPYTIPPTNPSKLTADPARKPAPEVWALGLRNPWRFSFDAADGSLWVADVGQDAWEEVDRVTAAQASAASRTGGLNFGWHIYEGLHAFPSGVAVSNRSASYVWPLLDYPHPTGESITGGYVYRGKDYPALVGTYLYADYIKGWIGGIRLQAPDGSPLASPEARTLLSTAYNPSSFGVDERGELYLVAYGGQIYRVTGSAK
jgi:glucose/arabinose dehydrogenase